MEPLIDKHAVAAILGVGHRTLDNWVSQGKGPTYVKVGMLRMYDPADIRAWIESRKVTEK